MSTVALSTKTPGDIVTINENGAPVEFYVAAQDYESGLNGAGRTLLVRKDCYDIRPWDADEVNAYAGSDLDVWFNGSYKSLLDVDIASAIASTTFRYTPGNGNFTVGVLSKSIFALSLTELGSTGAFAKVEGSTLPIATDLQIAYLNAEATSQWTRTPSSNNNVNVYRLGPGGSSDYKQSSRSYGSRPAFTIPGATTYVDDDGNVIFNQPPSTPVITPPSSCMWGVPTTATCTAVQDPEGETVTYEWGMSVDNEVWMPLQASGTSCTYTPFADHYLRVRAVDTAGNASGYDTTALITVQRWGGQIIYGGGA